MSEWPDLRLAALAAGTWLATIWALYLSAAQGITLAAIAAALAILAIFIPTGLLKARPGYLVSRLAARLDGLAGRLTARLDGFSRRRHVARATVPRAACGPERPTTRSAALSDGLATRSAGLISRFAARFDGAARRPAGRVDGGVLRWIFAIAAIGVACGAASTAAHVVVRERQPIAGLAATKSPVTVTAVIASDPRPVGSLHIGPPTYGFDIGLISVRAANVRADVDASVFVLASGDGWLGLLPGQRIVAHGRFEPSEPGELTAATMSISSPPQVVGRPPWTQRAAGSLRAGLQRACTGLPGQVRGLLPGLIDGDTTRLDPAVTAEFRATGMTHLVAVSGSNVVMILGAVLFAARWCRAGPILTALICALALVGFVILVRPSPSVLRAATMGGISLIALATGRARAAVPSLAAVIFALIVYDPALATDIGFGLSVFATAGLLLIAPGWRDALRRRGVRAGVAEALAVPAAAQVACSPLIAGFSGTVSLVAVPANLLAIPAVPPATVVGVAAAVLSPVWPTGAAFCAWVASWPARWLLFVAATGESAPSAVARWPSGVWGGLLLAAVLGGGMFALRYPAARVVSAVALLAALVGAVPVRLATNGWPPSAALFVMCDVGQGDGMVLPLGSNEGVVVDTGPEPTAIDGCLHRLGIDHIPIMFLTHFHADHVGGIAGVLDGRRIDAIVTSPFPQPPEGYAEVVRDAAARRIPISTPQPGQVYQLGALRLTVLGPVGRLVGTRSDPNNNSLVMRADEGNIRILLTGDAEIEEQTEVLATAGAAALRSDVLKMPHHGSAYQNPAFLAAVAPSVVFVSVGAVNPYGLPNLPTLGRLTTAGARVLQTDVDGDLAALSEGGRLAVEFAGLRSGQRPP
ncbi:MAG TPA: ComEC/Rec2 family competence protein [Micromonosporaceae bacterium]|jgi:competence protein ComEC